MRDCSVLLRGLTPLSCSMFSSIIKILKVIFILMLWKKEIVTLKAEKIKNIK